MNQNLSRFHEAQSRNYADALREIRSGLKRTHWMWYVFPQLRGLGQSSMSVFYGINGMDEAKAYMADPVLRARLLEITNAVLELRSSSIRAVFGHPDDKKLKSCMTLFEAAAPDCGEFAQVLERFYGGERDRRTLRMLGM